MIRQTRAGTEYLTPILQPGKPDRAQTRFYQYNLANDGSMALRSLAPLRASGRANFEIVDLATRFDGCDQPAWLLSSPGPRLRRARRVAVFRQNPRIFTSGLVLNAASGRFRFPRNRDRATAEIS